MNTRTALQSRHFAWLFIAAAGIEALSLPACAAARLEPPADLRTAINETLRRIEPAPNGHYIAHNPEQRLAVGFDGQGIRLAPSTKGSSWHWGLKLQGYGVPGRIAPVRRAQTVNHGPRLEYRRDGITEWYENRPEGLEQGFTLAHPPKAGVREVELRLSANGDLSLKLDTDGHGATLVDSAGKETLAYRKLDVVDARGKHLPAKLTLAGNALAIRVDVHGAAWPVVVDPLIYDIGQKLRAQTMFGGDDAQKDAGFGRAIALSADGRTALVGAPFAEVSGLPYAGTAYVYTLDAAGWTIEWKLVPQDTEGFGEFGTSVALSADGNTALIGAYGMTAAGQAEAGAAYLYTRTGGGWLFQQKLTAQTSGGADDAVKLGHFGMAVALTGDGNTAAVGALDANAGMVDYAGAVYLYGCTTDISDPWRKHCQVSQKIIAQKTDGTDDAESGAAFGDAVALSQDGGALLVGAYFADAEAGAAYVYKPWSDGWRIWQKLTAQTGSGKNDSEAGASFGASVALNSNGTEALISAFRATVSGKPKAGAAYVYRMVEDKHGIETWRIRQKLTAQTADGKNDASPDARFGKCALGPGVALIGAQQAPVDGLTEAGAAYLYRYQDKHWRIRQKLTAQTDAGASDVEANAHFGVTSLSANGGTAMVGAYGATASGKTGAGAVYAFESPYVLKVTTSVGAVGAVTSQPNGIVCGSGIYCQARFAKGTAVTLTAHPIEGYRFTGWSGGGCAGKKPCTVKLNKSKTVEAKYVPQQ